MIIVCEMLTLYSLCSVAILIDFSEDESIELMVSKKVFDHTIFGQLNLPKAPPPPSPSVAPCTCGAGLFAVENSAEFALTPKRKNPESKLKVQKNQIKPKGKTRALRPL